MPNPFPGVDPYVEAANLWPGFHNLLIADCCRALNRELKPRGYAAYAEERLELVDLPDGDEDRRPDLAVTHTGRSARPQAGGGAALLDIEPALVLNPAYETLSVAFIEVRHVPDQELVTSVEVLSPSNKGQGRGAYAAKRRAVIAAQTNLVEIDLLLAGRRPEVVGRIPAGDFCVLVSRGDRTPECQAFAWSIRRRLPRIPIPLRPNDQDATLDLPAAYEMAYDAGPYDVAGLYTRALPGPLSDADRVWVADHVRAAAQ